MSWLSRLFYREETVEPIDRELQEAQAEEMRALYPDVELVRGYPVQFGEWYTIGRHDYYADPTTPIFGVWRKPHEQGQPPFEETGRGLGGDEG